MTPDAPFILEEKLILGPTRNIRSDMGRDALPVDPGAGQTCVEDLAQTPATMRFGR